MTENASAVNILPCPFCGSKNIAFVKLCYGTDGINGYAMTVMRVAVDEMWKVILNWNVVSDGAKTIRSELG